MKTGAPEALMRRLWKSASEHSARVQHALQEGDQVHDEDDGQRGPAGKRIEKEARAVRRSDPEESPQKGKAAEQRLPERAAQGEQADDGEQDEGEKQDLHEDSFAAAANVGARLKDDMALRFLSFILLSFPQAAS